MEDTHEKERLLSQQFIENLTLVHRNFYRQCVLPLPLNQFGVLMSLYTEPEMSITALSQQLMVSKQQMSAIIDRLLQGGYVEKRRSAVDRRSLIITLTDAGRSIIDEQNEATRARFDAKTRRMDPKDIEALADSLHRFNVFLEKMSNVNA